MNTKLVIATLAASLSLAACGGGGSGSTPAPTPTPPAPTPTPPPSTALQLTVPPSTYAGGSVQLAAVTTINNARAAYGVGLVAENAKLSAAAQSHAQYIQGQLQAGDFQAENHTQDPLKPGFTGRQPADRIAFAGYAGNPVGEVLSGIIAVDGVASIPGEVAVNNLLSGPYHRFAFFDGWREIGFGATAYRLAGEGGIHNTVLADLGVGPTGQMQLPADTWLGVWPADQATGVMYSFAGESPNPIPALNGACGGYPVSFQVRNNFTLTVSSFTLVETTSGATISSHLATPTSDANPTYARANSAYIIPLKPLKLNTNYTARFVGARSGAPLDKSWTFTTTSSNTKLIYGCDPS